MKRQPLQHEHADNKQDNANYITWGIASSEDAVRIFAELDEWEKQHPLPKSTIATNNIPEPLFKALLYAQGQLVRHHLQALFSEPMAATIMEYRLDSNYIKGKIPNNQLDVGPEELVLDPEIPWKLVLSVLNTDIQCWDIEINQHPWLQVQTYDNTQDTCTQHQSAF